MVEVRDLNRARRSRRLLLAWLGFPISALLLRGLLRFRAIVLLRRRTGLRPLSVGSHDRRRGSCTRTCRWRSHLGRTMAWSGESPPLGSRHGPIGRYRLRGAHPSAHALRIDPEIRATEAWLGCDSVDLLNPHRAHRVPAGFLDQGRIGAALDHDVILDHEAVLDPRTVEA